MKMERILVLAVAFLLSLAACTNDEAPEGDRMVFRQKALQDVSKQIENNPNDDRLYYERGMILQNLRLDSMALEDFKKAARLDSTKAEYFSAIGNLMFEHQDISGSIKYLEKALKLNPKDPAAHLKMAKMFIYTKDYNKAFAEINIVLRQDVYNPEGYFLKGVIYKELEDTTKSLSNFLTALEVVPDYRPAMIQLGLLYSKQKNPMALGYFDNAFELDTADVFPIYAKGVYYQDQQKYEEAKEAYRNAVYRDRQYGDAYFNMGFIYMQQDSFENARRQYDLLTKIQPDDFEAYYNRGLANEMMGNKDEAIADYRQALIFNKNYELATEGLKRLGAQ